MLGLGLNISQLTAFSGCQLSIHRDSQQKHLVHHLKGSPAENIQVTIILPNLLMDMCLLMICVNVKTKVSTDVFSLEERLRVGTYLCICIFPKLSAAVC